jgi:tellurite resistance protein TerC
MNSMHIFDFKSWIIFNVLIVTFLLVDLKFLKNAKEEKIQREAITWSFIWFFLAILFGVFIGYTQGGGIAYEFLTVYLIEKSLSIDNLMVFVVIFQTFAMPKKLEQKVLLIGVFSALVMRYFMILGGIELINRFYFMVYVFGGVLMLTGIKLLFIAGGNFDLKQTYWWRSLNKFLGDTKQPNDQTKKGLSNFIKALIFVEISDIIFAVDSIPAALAITQNSFIVYTANAFAILGLRSLYHVVSGSMKHFVYFTKGLAIVLIMTSFKMLGIIKVAPGVSLLITVGIISLSVVLSLKSRKSL